MATLGLYPRDFILIASLLVMICSVAWNWDEYAGCKRPLHVWLIVDLCGILCFRVNQYLFALTASMRNRSGVLRLLPSIYAALNLYVLYPFLWVWTAIGCVWYNQSSSCLPPEMSGWSYLAWIAFSYLYLVAFGAVLYGTYRMRLRARTYFSEEFEWSQAEIEEFMQQFQEAHAFGLTPSVGLGMGLTPQQLDGIRERVVTGMEVMANGDDADLTCSICLVDLEVGDSYRDIQCEHIFHSACLDQWLAIKANCAKCRAPVRVGGAAHEASERTPLIGTSAV